MNQEQFSALMERARAKYDAGQKEHGGLLIHRDCLAELEAELIDAWFYYQANAIKRNFALVASPELIREESIRRAGHADFQITKAGNEECIAPRISMIEYHLYAVLDLVVQERARQAENLRAINGQGV